jgi:prolipoprotein diacylglyceryltransferase
VGWLIGVPLRRWMDVAIVPLLLAIGLGKFANLLGGAGQGAPTDGEWALAFAGGGPWRSVGADIPAHPSQVYEGAWALAGVLLVGLVVLIPLAWRRLRGSLRARTGEGGGDGGSPDGTGDPASGEGGSASGEGSVASGGTRPGLLFGLGLAWWAIGRVVVGSTWRDEMVLAGLNMEQLAAIGLLAILLVAFVAALWPRRRPAY